MTRLTPVILIISFCIYSCGPNTVLKNHTTVASYPSASGIEYADKKLFVIGDDANTLLILDEELKPQDSVALYTFPEKRIPKSVKADLESVTLTRDNRIFLLGSGSLSPNRDVAWLIDPGTKQKDSINLQPFFDQVRTSGIKEVNVEGLTAIPGNMVLANRGSKGYPKNHLIITSQDFWKNPATAPISLVMAGGSADSSLFNGISGLAYSSKSDRMIMSVSTEDTRNALDDGAIGKSYLWIIQNFSSKKRWKGVNPDQIVDLETIDPVFKGQKIESVCVTKETNNFLYLVLAADNDKGSSNFFKIILEK